MLSCRPGVDGGACDEIGYVVCWCGMIKCARFRGDGSVGVSGVLPFVGALPLLGAGGMPREVPAEPPPPCWGRNFEEIENTLLVNEKNGWGGGGGFLRIGFGGVFGGTGFGGTKRGGSVEGPAFGLPVLGPVDDEAAAGSAIS